MENSVNKTYLSLIDKFKSKKVLVIGDLILDVYYSGNCTRISPEAPVPVLDVNHKKYCLGGAANVAANLKSLGCEVTLCALTGIDDGRSIALNLLKEAGVENSHLLGIPGRSTLIKTRVATDEQCLVRIDEGTSSSIDSVTEEKVIKKIKELNKDVDAVLISDYDKGLLTPQVIDSLEGILAADRKFVAIDSKNLSAYKKIKPDLVKPNYKEFLNLINSKGQLTDRADQVKRFAKELYNSCNAEISAVTLDKDGVVLFSKDQFDIHLSAPAVKSPKVSGAGDSFISAFLLGLLAEASVSEAATIALETARIAIEKEETALCSKSELKLSFGKNEKTIAEDSSLKELCDFYHSRGKRIVFTNGCFDILHRGHIEYLKQARELGDVLIVGINNDGSIKRLKGNGRPINNLMDRMEVLSALGCVDHVFSFGSVENDTPTALIKIVKPNVFVKGGDYKDKIIPEKAVLEECGAEIHFLPFVKNLSTSNIIDKISHGSRLQIVKTG